MPQRMRVFFLNEAQLRDAAFADEQNRQTDPRRGRQRQRHGHQGVGIENADARRGHAGNADLQKTQHRGGAADVVVERHERERGGIRKTQPQRGQRDEEQPQRRRQAEPAVDGSHQK